MPCNSWCSSKRIWNWAKSKDIFIFMSLIALICKNIIKYLNSALTLWQLSIIGKNYPLTSLATTNQTWKKYLQPLINNKYVLLLNSLNSLNPSNLLNSCISGF